VSVGNVWTNTLADGTPASSLDCEGWTAIEVMGKFIPTTLGWPSATDASWTNVADGQLCLGGQGLYCFQDG
jgi:hypothetical protein